MFNHNGSTTGRIASNHLVRIALVAVVLLSAIGVSGALAQPAAAESTDFPQEPFTGGEEFPQEPYIEDDDPTYIAPGGWHIDTDSGLFERVQNNL